MKTFLGFIAGVCIGAIGFASIDFYMLSTDEDYAKRQMMFAGYDHVFLIKSKKEDEAE